MKIKKAIIPAAGYGTRFLPVTKAIAKEMLPIIDTPTIEYIVREALESGIEDILIIVSSNKNAIMDYFDNNFELEYQLKEKNKLKELERICELPNKINIHFIRQHEQLGLGHAVLCAKTFVAGEPFAVLLGDDVYVGNNKPALRQLMDAYEETSCSILGTLEVPDADVSKYGICDPKKVVRKGLSLLNSVVEKPSLEEAPSHSAIGGRYILDAAIFDYLENQERGAGNEIQLTDAIKRMMNNHDVYSLDIDGRRYDIGSKMGFIEATIDFGLEREDLKDSLKKLLESKLK
ncbi:MAG: UTP--glucose-1-phosphate uridylyltransferase GalU [Anaeroplasmataceae bacterium]